MSTRTGTVSPSSTQHLLCWLLCMGLTIGRCCCVQVYVGDIYLLDERDIIHTNLTVREGLGESRGSGQHCNLAMLDCSASGSMRCVLAYSF